MRQAQDFPFISHHPTTPAGWSDSAAVAKLPADEREACKKLWSDVEALLHKAQQKTK